MRQFTQLRAVNTQNQTYRQGPAASCDNLEEVHHRILIFHASPRRIHNRTPDPLKREASRRALTVRTNAPERFDDVSGGWARRGVATFETCISARTYSRDVSSNASTSRVRSARFGIITPAMSPRMMSGASKISR